MVAFTQLDIEGASSDEMNHSVPNAALEITRGYWLTLEWDEMIL
jgi:hypothetical protein